MSLRPDGAYHCDRCGATVGNAGYTEAVNISGMDPDDPGSAWRIHLCLACRDVVLNRDSLTDYYKTRS